MTNHELETITLEATDLIGGFFQDLGIDERAALTVLTTIFVGQATLSGVPRETVLLAVGRAYDNAITALELMDGAEIH